MTRRDALRHLVLKSILYGCLAGSAVMNGASGVNNGVPSDTTRDLPDGFGPAGSPALPE